MLRPLPFLLLACLSLGLAEAPALAQTAERQRVDVLQVEGPIDRVSLDYLHERLDLAERDGAVVVLQIDTPGALDEDGVALAERVADLDVPVIAWVGPAPARASGAGLLLMYASSIAAVSPGSQTGPLYPVDLAAPEARPDLAATITGWLEARGKATRRERLDQPLPGADAVALGIADPRATANSIAGLLQAVDGLEVSTARGPATLATAIATTTGPGTSGVDIRFADMGPIRRTLHAVATPTFAFVLLVMGLAALAFELTQPGFGFAGFSGAFLLGLAVYSFTIVPFSIPGVALLVGGVGLAVWDVARRRLGPVSAAGLVAFAAGSVLTFSGLGDALSISPWMVGGAIVASVLYYGFALTVALQSRDRIVETQRGLIGLRGEARGRLAPDGPVYVKGTVWRGRTAGEVVEVGVPIRVRGVEGLILRVEAEPTSVGAQGDVDDPG